MSKDALLAIHQIVLVLLVAEIYTIGAMVGLGLYRQSAWKRALFVLLCVIAFVSGICVGLLAQALKGS